MQNIKFKNEGPYSFKVLAETAAALERKEAYSEASAAWSEAHMAAKNEQNRLWATARAGQCDRKILR